MSRNINQLSKRRQRVPPRLHPLTAPRAGRRMLSHVIGRLSIDDRLNLDVSQTPHNSPCLSGFTPIRASCAQARSHRAIARANSRPTDLSRMLAAAAMSR
jgi:hypothetical protein